MVDLIGVAKKSLASAATAQQQSHDLIVRQYQAQQSALDTAFDADVRLAAAGGLKNAKGEPITLSADWIISARKGYTAARELLAEQIRQEQETHAVELDMAKELTILQWNVGEQIKQKFLKMSQYAENMSATQEESTTTTTQKETTDNGK